MAREANPLHLQAAGGGSKVLEQLAHMPGENPAPQMLQGTRSQEHSRSITQ